jgi:hypothetical protein
MIGRITYGTDFFGALAYLNGEKTSYTDRLDRPAPRNPKERLLWADTYCCIRGGRNLGPEHRWESIAQDMDDLASENSRVEKPVAHFVIGFAPTDTPDREIVRRVVQGVREDLGLSRHQTYVGIHGDARTRHAHIICNRVDPRSPHRAWDRWKDRMRLRDSLIRLEKRHDLYRTPRNRQDNWAALRIREQCSSRLELMQCWEDFDDALVLTEFDGLLVFAKGSGSVVRAADYFESLDREEPSIEVAASSIHPSLGRPRLERTFGEDLPTYTDRRSATVTQMVERFRDVAGSGNEKAFRGAVAHYRRLPKSHRNVVLGEIRSDTTLLSTLRTLAAEAKRSADSESKGQDRGQDRGHGRVR